MVPIVRLMAARCQGEGLFYFAIHDWWIPSRGSGLKSEERRAGSARRSFLAVAIGVPQWLPDGACCGDRVIFHPATAPASIVVLAHWGAHRVGRRLRRAHEGGGDVQILAFEADGNSAIEPCFNARLVPLHGRSQAAAS